jgi:hypothetical protein
MKTIRFTSFILLIIAFANMFPYTAAGQTKKAKPAGADSPALIYNYPQGKAVDYRSKEKITQIMDIQGQQMQVNIESSRRFSVLSAGMQGKNINLQIKVDSLYQSVDSPQGTTGGNVSDAKDKTFAIVISPSGKEISTEAEQVKFNVPGSGPSNMAQFFNKFFPVMPEGSVKPGYAWPSTDTISYKSETGTMFQVVKAQNTFSGFEDFKGTNCAKIISVLEGNWQMKNTTAEVDMNVNGSFTGTATTYFAPSAGYFLQKSTTVKMKGNIDMVSPMAMSFPVVMDVTGVDEVVK